MSANCRRHRILPYEEFVALRERLADAEDLTELRKAKRTGGRKRSIPLAEPANDWVCAVSKRQGRTGFLITAYPTDAG